MTAQRLETLTPGMAVPFGGDRVTFVTRELAERFVPGDRLIVEQQSGTLLHIPAAEQALAEDAVGRAHAAFMAMGQVSDAAITNFFDRFAAGLADDDVWADIQAANRDDVARAKVKGRSTTRLVASNAMRDEMIAGLRQWRDADVGRERVLERVDHDGWSVDQFAAPLGVVAFVFEGRPNVFADACGVIRSGNTVVFRIGSDALGTARAIVSRALEPALAAAGLPVGAASLVNSAEHASAWAMFCDRRVALAVARGSGQAVAQLGAVARQAGTPVSLHGTGGAWIIADTAADPVRLAAAVENSLDRKACNTLGVCCIVRSRAAALTPVVLEALRAAGIRRGQGCKLHVVEGGQAFVPARWLTERTTVRRAEGDSEEALTELMSTQALGTEWEWEETPEISLVIVEDLAEAIDLFNRYSPQFIAAVISQDAAARASAYRRLNAPFVGDGMTRWVDGQFALSRPELGLSNWENGRLFARAGVLAGDGVFTVRTRMQQSDPGLSRWPKC